MGRLAPTATGHLHAHFGWVAATAAWAAASLDDRSFSVSLHAFEIYDRRYVDGFTGIPLRAAKAVFTESHRDQALVGQRWAVRPVVTRLGVPTDWLEDGGGARETDLIVSVGRLAEKKGYRVLLQALVLTEHPWRCEIVGDGPQRDELEALIAQLDLTTRVTLCGAFDERGVRRALERAAVSCLASIETPTGDRDGTPMALIEAMASGAAVVATDTGSIGELLDDTGVVVPPDDAAVLAAAWLDKMWDPDFRADLSSRAVARVRGEWTAPRTAETVVEALRASS